MALVLVFSLARCVYSSVDRRLVRGMSGCVRCGVRVTQNVSVFEILGVGTHLEVSFKGILAFDGGEAAFRGGGWGGHDCVGWLGEGGALGRGGRGCALFRGREGEMGV